MFWTSGSMDIRQGYNFNSQEQMSYGDSETQLGQTGSRGHWTWKSKLFGIALSFFILATIGLSIGLALTSLQLTKSRLQYKMEHPCLTPDCVQVAGEILSRLDKGVDPCLDFYSFACGGWNKENPSPPPTQTTWGQFEITRDRLSLQLKDILEEEIRDEDSVPKTFLLAQEFYDSCLTPVQGGGDTVDLLSRIEGILGSTDSFNPNNFTNILVNLKRELDGNYIFGLDVDLDEQNTTRHGVYLDQPRFGIPPAFLVDRDDNQWKTNYLTLITTVWKFLFPEDAFRAPTIATHIINIEKSLASIATSPDERRNRTSTYTPVTLSQLQNITRDGDALDWGLYFKGLFQYSPFFNNKTGTMDMETESTEHVTTGQVGQPTGNFTIIMRDMNFFTQLSSVLDVKYNGRDILNYLKWRIILDYGSEASDELRWIFFDYAKATHGYLLAPEKWRLCVEETNIFLGMALSYPYVIKHFTHKYAQQASDLVRDVRDGFEKILGGLDWLDPLTRDFALKKAKTMKSFVGFPNWLTHVKEVDEYYWGLDNFNHPDSHLSNYFQLAKWSVNKNLAKAFRDKDPTEWIVDPTMVNAFYSYEHNSINFPAGILQPPFFRMPIQALNYGSIGSIIGHEITHGFDETGRQSDWEGKTGEWWERSTLQSYFQRANCFREEYANFTKDIRGTTWHVDGNLTLSENIADNGGLWAGFEAYEIYRRREGEEGPLPGLEEFNPSQLFLIAYAQVWCGSSTDKSLQEQLMMGPHAPNEFRVKGSLRNFPPFNHIWKCNKTERERGNETIKTCRIW